MLILLAESLLDFISGSSVCACLKLGYIPKNTLLFQQSVHTIKCMEKEEIEKIKIILLKYGFSFPNNEKNG